MARRVSGGIDILIDQQELIDFLGAGKAVSEMVSDPDYVDALVRAAHGQVEDEFNMEAAAYAASTGRIKHMYEWGTQGINRARTNMRPNPMDPRARLWEDLITGVGMHKQLIYVFKPSVAIVPKPTVRDTGMSPDVINSLRDHVFHSKASVLELGTTVTINPIRHPWLLIPYYEPTESLFSNYDKQRGFTLWKNPVVHSPGDTAGSTGQFTAFWAAFWEGRGQRMIDMHMEKQIESDFMAMMLAKSGGGLERPNAAKVKSEVDSKARSNKRTATTKARSRRRTK